MHRAMPWLVWLWAGVLVCPVGADVLVLQSGGRLSGQIVSEPNPPAGPGRWSIRTLSGATVEVEAGDVASVQRRTLVREQYADRLARTPDTAAGQLALADWCREQGLTSERTRHLEQVLRHEPQNETARKALGHRRHGGTWMSPDEVQQSKGFVKHKGKWVLPQEVPLLEQEEQDSAAQRQWFKPVKMWYGWLLTDDPQRQAEGLGEFRQLRDPTAAVAVIRTFQKAQAEPLRLLLAEVLSNLECPASLRRLVELTLHDDSGAVRDRALQGFRLWGGASAQPVYLRALRNDNNLVVNRAGWALGKLGDDKVVPELIEALVTRHRYQAQVPENMIGATSDGRWMQAIDPSTLPPQVATMLAAGQLPQGVIFDSPFSNSVRQRMRTVYFNVDEKNLSVREALTQLTGEDFQFDEPTWRRWRAGKLAQGAGQAGRRTTRP